MFRKLINFGQKQISKIKKKSNGVVSKPPNWITIGITNACNNRCVFCSYHCEEARGNSNVYNIPFTMPFEDFKRIVDMAYKGKVPRVHICGTGEPFLNKDIIKMIDYSIKVYGHTSIQTNFYKPLFDKNNYLNELILRKDNISNITTDILSGNPEIHNELKKGSSYYDVLDALEYLSGKTNIQFNISYVLSKFNYNYIDMLIDDLVKRGIRNASIKIGNLYSYDFNKYTSTSVVYTSDDVEITEALKKAFEYGKSHGIKVILPQPADLDTGGCRVFWDKIQIWPVIGNDPKRYHENLIPHACRAVVKGNLNSLGYIFDYHTIMEMWNNDIIVSIRENLLNDIYPSDECRFCYHYNGKDSVFKMKKQWANSAKQHLEKFKNSQVVQELNATSICIDCGANVGLITEVFAKKGAIVYSFEPNPIPFEKMKEKFKDNKNVHLYQKGVSVKDEKLKLYMYQYHQEDDLFWSVGASTCATKDDIDKNSFIEVECIDIVRFIEEIENDIDILKLDIEGGEYDILERLITTGLYKKIKNILVETHDKHIPDIIPKGKIVRDLIKNNNIKNINLDWI